ncbi:F-box protein At3g07870-like [Lotus japonicus]|uniref:F-box protein At3g07870-like n=1 Tax=Lotus japonicus TaxID=34305 RepID=UPI0025826C3C|nr:F-box protein At3g07870-like [Lotus japonicus]
MRKKGVPNRFTRASGIKAVDPEIQHLETSLTDLPSHITIQILLRLPLKSILKCKCVCRSLKSLISNPEFTHLHFKEAKPGVMIRSNDSRTLHLLDQLNMFEDGVDKEKVQFCGCFRIFINHICRNPWKLDPKFKLPFRESNYSVVNSCNGLICLCDPLNNNPLAVSNPVTGEFIRLPDSHRIHYESHGTLIYVGFGFQPKTNEYKVVRILKESPRRSTFLWYSKDLVVQVHTVGTSTWKNVVVDPKLFIRYLTFPTCVNGVLHWIVSHDWRGLILCFNFESESFEYLPTPPGVFKNNGITDIERISMAELKGFLYICDSSSKDIPVVVWIMKEYGIGESWTKIFSVDTRGEHCWPLGGLYWPVKHFEKVDAILMFHSDNYFIYYEPKRSFSKSLMVRGRPMVRRTGSTFDVFPYIPSLISLKDVVKEDNVEVLNVYSR